MKSFLQKLKENWKKTALASSLFLIVFFGLYYLSNWDFNPREKTVTTATDLKVKTDEELQKKIGSTDVTFMDYGQWALFMGLNNSNNGYDQDPDGDGLSNWQEYVYLTNPTKADTDGDGYTDKQEIAAGYDPSESKGNPRLMVEIDIAKIGVEVPMIWSTSTVESDMLKDLENGVAHFAQTAAPGQPGNIIISGHSSNYVWAKGNYNHIFKDLNNLEVGDMINVKTTEHNGRVVIYHYEVKEKRVTTANDQTIFEQGDASELTLSTCWPIGTALKRLIVKAQLIK